jgi:hypothetical protein
MTAQTGDIPPGPNMSLTPGAAARFQTHIIDIPAQAIHFVLNAIIITLVVVIVYHPAPDVRA